MVTYAAPAAIDSFLQSEAARALPDAPRAAARAILERFLACVVDEAGSTPAELDGGGLHFVVGHLLPARFAIGDPLAEHTAPVLHAFLRAQTPPLSPARLAELALALEGTLDEFRESVRTGEAVHHHAHGDVGEAPFVRTEAKVGRNDPCPCGSGRKFKQCCA
jgi:hypothetical protein